MQFTQTYKTLLIRNIAGPQSVAANCEATDDNNLLQLKDLVLMEKAAPARSEVFNSSALQQYIAAKINTSLTRRIERAALGYVSGFVAKRVLSQFNCELCRNHILQIEGASPNQSHHFIIEKEFGSKRSLKYCTIFFINCVSQIYNITKLIVANYGISQNVRACAKNYIKEFVKFSFTCEHKDEIIDMLITNVVHIQGES